MQKKKILNRLKQFCPDNTRYSALTDDQHLQAKWAIIVGKISEVPDVFLNWILVFWHFIPAEIKSSTFLLINL